MNSTDGSTPGEGIDGAGTPEARSGSAEADKVFDRLRAADPAAEVGPDMVALRTSVDARIAGSASASAEPTVPTAPSVPAASTASPVVDLAAARERRRSSRWLQVAAASAGVLAVGVGGYALGNTSDGDAGGPAPAVAEVPAVGTAAPGAPERSDGGLSSAASADKMMVGPSGLRTIFSASGLDDTPGSAHAWGFDAASVFSAETAARLAAAFGVEGEPVVSYGAWHVGSLDWTAPSLDLQPDAQAAFSYSNPLIDAWSETSTATSVSDEDAVAALSAVMTAVGADPAAFSFDVNTYEGARDTSVTAQLVVDGAVTGLVWQASVTSEGVTYASGQVAPLVDLGAYDLVGATTAVGRLSDPRFGATPDYIAYAATSRAMEDPSFGAAVDAPAAEELAVDPGATTEPYAPGDSSDPSDPTTIPPLPPTATPGQAFSWPLSAVTITGASLTTTTLYSADGSAALVPAYQLTGSDGSVWTVVAVTDGHLDFAATS